MIKPTKSRDLTAEEITELKEAGRVRGGKAIVSKARIKNPNQQGVNMYVLEDGTEIMENDAGQAVAKWPSPALREKSEIREGPEPEKK